MAFGTHLTCNQVTGEAVTIITCNWFGKELMIVTSFFSTDGLTCCDLSVAKVVEIPFALNSVACNQLNKDPNGLKRICPITK